MPRQSVVNRKRKSLVFTSAGDHSAVTQWVAKAARTFDLCVVYYGDRPEAPELQSRADFFYKRKGSKFQNLYWMCGEHPGLIEDYDAVFVLDDDIVIDGSGIEDLFHIRRSLDLWMLQPAFWPSGRISHRITRVRPTRRLRFTSFVEVACPLVRTDKLLAFFQVYDRRLVGWGVDYWLSLFLDDGSGRRIAIVDEVPCVNPHHEFSKNGTRQIDALQPSIEREAVWGLVAAEHGLPREGVPMKEYGAVGRPWRECVRPVMRFAYSVLLGLGFRARNKLIKGLAKAGPPLRRSS